MYFLKFKALIKNHKRIKFCIGGVIYLYWIKVGTAVKPIPQGQAITTGNTINAISEIQRNTPRNFKWTSPGIEAFKNKSFMG